MEPLAVVKDFNPLKTATLTSAQVANWLFVVHPEAGERSAVIYKLLGGCRWQGITSFDFLKDLFTQLPAAKITQFKAFTPATWFNAKTKDKLIAETTEGVLEFV